MAGRLFAIIRASRVTIPSAQSVHQKLMCSFCAKRLHSVITPNQPQLVPRIYSGIGRGTPTLSRIILRNQTAAVNWFSDSQSFHTSSRRNVNPLFILIAKQLAKGVSMLTGRRFRKWWKTLSPEEKAEFKQHLRTYEHWFLGLAALIGVFGVYNYYSHIQEAPVTNRRRYISFTPEQFSVISEFEYEQIWEQVKDHVVPPNQPVYKTIVDITTRLVNANQDLDFFTKQHWRVIVVDSEEANAFVLPNGYIFVYTGLLKVTKNVDQLAVVLGHEMSHALLQHGPEKISWSGLLDYAFIMILAALWAFVPSDGIAAITQWFMNKVMEVMLHLPYDREMENEADRVGLLLAAKACYDVREGSNLWQLMSINHSENGDVTPPEWLSTHPANETRVGQIDSLVPKMLDLRQTCKCPPLPKTDPRESMRKIMEEYQVMQEKKAAEEKLREERELVAAKGA